MEVRRSDVRLLLPLRGNPSPGLWPSPFSKGALWRILLLVLNLAAHRPSDDQTPSAASQQSIPRPLAVPLLQGGALGRILSLVLNLAAHKRSDIRLLQPLRSNPSPGLWPSPFSKGALWRILSLVLNLAAYRRSDVRLLLPLCGKCTLPSSLFSLHSSLPGLRPWTSILFTQFSILPPARYR